jgi:hypothetical protein
MSSNNVPSFTILSGKGMNTVTLDEVVCNIMLTDKTVPLKDTDVIYSRLVTVNDISQFRFEVCIWIDFNTVCVGKKEKINSSMELLC